MPKFLASTVSVRPCYTVTYQGYQQQVCANGMGAENGIRSISTRNSYQRARSAIGPVFFFYCTPGALVQIACTDTTAEEIGGDAIGPL